MAKIMIVDDSQMVRKALRIFLEAGNHEIVFEAKTGVEAVREYKRVKPDIVTMDLEMPEMNGIDATKKIKLMDPDAKIIIMSALNQKEMVMDSLSAGAKNYILKPITKDKTLTIVDEVLRKN